MNRSPAIVVPSPTCRRPLEVVGLSNFVLCRSQTICSVFQSGGSFKLYYTMYLSICSFSRGYIESREDVSERVGKVFSWEFWLCQWWHMECWIPVCGRTRPSTHHPTGTKILRIARILPRTWNTRAPSPCNVEISSSVAECGGDLLNY